MLDKVSPKVSAALSFPMMLIVSLPFAYIAGAFAIITVDQFGVPLDSPGIGYGVGITVAIIFALWASYGMYTLATEVREEAGAEAVSA